MVSSAPKTKKPKKAKVSKAKSKAKHPKLKLAGNPGRKKAVSLWTSGPDRKLFDRARKRFGDSLSELVRVLIAAYDRGDIALTDGTVKVQAPAPAPSLAVG
jgi:hypothetical protein